MKSGFAIIIGRSNVGKSTLLNTLVGSKLAIVTNKAQTTRSVIHGALTDERGQVVFMDTPGVLQGSHAELTGRMIEKVKEALHGIDVILYVVDPTRGLGAEERYTLSLIRGASIPKFLVINKIDLDKKPYLEDYRALSPDFTQTFEISAADGSHIKPLINATFDALPEGEPTYDGLQNTNQTRAQWLAEIIREKALHETRAEVPYSMHVIVDNIEEKQPGPKNPHMFVIKARILVSADRYKKMLIGTGGRIIKEIGSVARKELEGILDTRVFLEIEVETNPRWMEML